ncbi:flagellar biosynthesis protein FlhB [Blastochloris viridis]|uniref:Flagellar biosynthetic protein FlhB n=1 Tax=Blastochloris viridis TaxID=1079 RepID=A0A0H5B6V2_BLAVI|nr:flagellar biosynthesis protein FlhB [Blastochloris viridis]ALK08802.1 Flagellar biosynthetic protein FlhB [Blastochloris viridis]BAR97900.1 flagellar biosynthesis protein FlhB [Blastochloris viridis]CUU41463.1 Flagellar biosynthetic protein flhB [Blastochloris viridis]
MAEGDDDTERTEDPTPKRLEDAIKRGDVARSQEVNTWFVLSGGALMLMIFSSSIAGGLTTSFRGILSNAHAIPADGGGLTHFVYKMALETVGAVGLPLLLMALAGVAASMLQHRLLWTVDPITPKLSKISPINGLKRLFGKEALVQFVKGLAKIGIVGSVLYAILWPQRERLALVLASDAATLLELALSLSLKLFIGVIAVMTVVAVLDYMYQWMTWHQKLRMSFREVREEFKQSEGDPHVKARIRSIRQSRMKKRMMAQVPKASVVITNPTHFAVALQYERGMRAPICLAKGVDALALKIREVAAQHDIPVIENPPLARALHASVELDAEIAPEHYKAVAEVIGYVLGIRRHLRPS